MEGAEEIILTFDAKTKFETNYDDFFYIYKEDGELYQKFINDQLAGKTVIVPGSSVTLRLTTDYSTDDWGFAVTKAYGTTHKWDDGSDYKTGRTGSDRNNEQRPARSVVK